MYRAIREAVFPDWEATTAWVRITIGKTILCLRGWLTLLLLLFRTICEADAIPFGPGPGESEIIDAESLQIRTRQRTIAHALFAAGGGFLSRGIVGGLDLR